jgi:hypothetical protein
MADALLGGEDATLIVDATAPDPLGPGHRPGNRRGSNAVDGREPAPGARLPRLPGLAVAGQALWSIAA